MRIDINKGDNKQKQTMRLKAEAILRYLISDDDKIDTLITCKTSDIDLVTTDLDVYEALGSIKGYDNFNFNKLKKLFEVTDVISYKGLKKEEKPILKDERVEELRKLALKK
jgi:hypothetical protein